MLNVVKVLIKEKKNLERKMRPKQLLPRQILPRQLLNPQCPPRIIDPRGCPRQLSSGNSHLWELLLDNYSSEIILIFILQLVLTCCLKSFISCKTFYVFSWQETPCESQNVIIGIKLRY